jgi:hypothetical protein
MLRLVSYAALLVALGGCRTALDPFPPAGSEGTGNPDDGAGAGAPGTGGSGGSDLPPEPCVMQAAGPAVEMVAFPDRHAYTPNVRVVDDGVSERLFVQTFASGGTNPAHPDIQLLEYRAGAAWPGGLEHVSGPTLFGIESHSFGLLVNGPPTRNELAMVWYGDPGGVGRPLFRRLGLPDAVAHDPVDVMMDGEYLLDFVSGADGYALAWRKIQGPDTDFATSGISLLDADGVVRAGPVPLTAPHPYPGESASLTWTGSVYLAAIDFEECVPDDTLCQPHSVVVIAIDPVTAATQVAAAFPVGAMSAASRPAVASWNGRTYLSWGEGPAGSTLDYSIRIAELAPSGAVQAGPLEVESGVELVSRPTLLAGETGVSISWISSGAEVPDDVHGRNTLLMTHLNHDLLVQSSRLSVDIPYYSQYGAPHGATLRDPRGALVVFTARLPPPGHEGVFAARFDCQ